MDTIGAGVLADLDPPGTYPLADLNPLTGFGPLTKLSENRYHK